VYWLLRVAAAVLGEDPRSRKDLSLSLTLLRTYWRITGSRCGSVLAIRGFLGLELQPTFCGTVSQREGK
jgi:hypothetical protein